MSKVIAFTESNFAKSEMGGDIACCRLFAAYTAPRRGIYKSDELAPSSDGHSRESDEIITTVSLASQTVTRKQELL